MSEIYRDRSEGTAAKRQELLRRRREELVTMPHAVRRVVVARTARIAASMVATLFGVGLLAASYSPNLAGRLASVMPGIQPAPLSTLLSGAWLLGLVAWAISRARVEHRFAVAMSKYVLPTNDLDHDVERLDHEHPDDIARSMGHDLEVRSAAWAVLAAGVVLPATGLWLARMLRTHGWPVMSEFELALALHAKALVMIAACSAVAAIAMTRKTLRQPASATLLVPIGVLASGVTIAGFMKQASFAWIACGVAVVATSVGLIARALRKERALLEVDDPAAGSELFTIRGMIRQIRGSLVSIKQAFNGLSRRTLVTSIVVVGAGTMICGGLVMVSMAHRSAEAKQKLAFDKAAVVRPTESSAVEINTRDSLAPTSYKIEKSGALYRIEATFDQTGMVTVPMLGYDTLPIGWAATLDVKLVNLSAGRGIAVMTKTGDHFVSTVTPEASIEIDACREQQPLALQLKGEPGQSVTVFVSPRLRTADCTPEPPTLRHE